MNVQETPQEKPPEIEQLVDALVDGKLAGYLLDSATANALIKDIASETGLPRVAVRIAFKLLAPLIVNKAEASAGWFRRRLLNRSVDTLARLPGYSLIAGKLLVLRAKLDRDIERRQQLDDILAGARPPTDIEHAEGLTQEIRFGLRHLAELGAMQAHIDARFDELLARLNPQPPLTVKLLERSEANRLRFGAQRVPFIGRQAELERLGEFLEAPDRFSWWLVTGSGGQGKSRLALELCLRAGTAWRAGFLPEVSTFDSWDTWQPESATLIVVDYVATRPEQIRRIITSLLNREYADPLDAPIRLLLLERSKERTWERSMERTWWDLLITSDQTGYAIEARQFAPTPVDLGPVSEDELWLHIVEILSQAETPLPNRKDTLFTLAKIDPERRPLFAAFAADALISSGNIRGWDQARLLRDVLDREREFHWRPAGVTESYENLLCLATMTGGASIEVLTQPDVGIDLPVSNAFKPAIYRALTGLSPTETSGSPILPALEPDILGAFFVLEHLKPLHPATNQPAERFRQAAWGRPVWEAAGFATFLDRAKDDFPDHLTLPLLLVPAIQERYQRRFWAMLAVNLTNVYSRAGRADDACKVLKDLCATVEANPDDAETRLCLAQATVNLLAGLGNAGEIEAARALYDDLARLAESHAADAAVRLWQARGAHNLMTDYASVQRFDRAESLFRALCQLSAAHRDEVEIHRCRAGAAYNLITDYCSVGETALALLIYDDLAQFAVVHSELTGIRLWQARGAVNLILAQARAGKTKAAWSLYTELVHLARTHPGETAVRASQGQSAFNLIKVFGDLGKFRIARLLCNDLAGLAAQRQGDVEICLWFARGAFNLIIDYRTSGHLDDARSMAMAAKRALLSTEFAVDLRERFGEERAAQMLASLRSLMDP